MHQQPLGDFAPELKPELSQYHTPVRLARRMVRWANVTSGSRVLEPSAGGGNIVRALAGWHASVSITAVEIDPQWCDVLNDEFHQHHGFGLLEGSFLDVQGWQFDLAIMNPPLNDGEGLAHVAHALTMAPRVVTLLRTGDLHGSARYNEFWRDNFLLRLAVLVRRPRFGGEHSAQTDFVVAELATRAYWEQHDLPENQLEHWPDTWA